MCMAPDIPEPKAPIVPESVKRTSKDQRRATEGNTAANAAAASATNTTGTGLGGVQAATQKKSLLGA